MAKTLSNICFQYCAKSIKSKQQGESGYIPLSCFILGLEIKSNTVLFVSPSPSFFQSHFIMSRSHSYSSNHSRGSRQHQSPNLAVTEASFQSLQLSDTNLPPSYSTSDRYSSRGSYGQESLSTDYLNPGYDTVSFTSSSPSGSYLGSQRRVSPLATLGQDSSNFFDTEASSYSRADMRWVLRNPNISNICLMPSYSSYSAYGTNVPSNYHGQASYPSSRSPSMQGNSAVHCLDGVV